MIGEPRHGVDLKHPDRLTVEEEIDPPHVPGFQFVPQLECARVVFGIYSTYDNAATRTPTRALQRWMFAMKLPTPHSHETADARGDLLAGTWQQDRVNANEAAAKPPRC